MSGERLTSGLVSYGYLVAAIFSVAFFVALMRGMLALPTGVLGHLLVVADFGIRFSFYAVLITQVQGIAFPGDQTETTGAGIRRPLVRSLLWPVLAGFTILILRMYDPS